MEKSRRSQLPTAGFLCFRTEPQARSLQLLQDHADRQQLTLYVIRSANPRAYGPSYLKLHDCGAAFPSSQRVNAMIGTQVLTNLNAPSDNTQLCFRRLHICLQLLHACTERPYNCAGCSSFAPNVLRIHGAYLMSPLVWVELMVEFRHQKLVRALVARVWW